MGTFTYYTDAVDFLLKNDPSFEISLQLAADLGLTIIDINSVILANVLDNEMTRNEFFEKAKEIQIILDTLS